MRKLFAALAIVAALGCAHTAPPGPPSDATDWVATRSAPDTSELTRTDWIVATVAICPPLRFSAPFARGIAYMMVYKVAGSGWAFWRGVDALEAAHRTDARNRELLGGAPPKRAPAGER